MLRILVTTALFAAAASAAENTARPVRILALGDSYTIGQGIGEDGRWPVQLTARLNEAKVATAAPEIIARTGWTTAELWDATEKQAPKGPYDLVTLLIGVNNQFRGLDEGAYRMELVALLFRSIQLAGGDARRVVVLSIPDYGVTPFGQRHGGAAVSTAIDRFNAIKAEECRRAGVRFVDITPVSRQAKENPALIADDQLHPSASMYAEWAKLALPVVQEALKK